MEDFSLASLRHQEIQAYPVCVEFIPCPSPDYIEDLKQDVRNMNVENVGALLLQDTLVRRQSEIISVLQNETYIDNLTGLGNRKKLELEYMKAIDAGHKIEILFIDLNNFKSINDDYSHADGDVALMCAAEGISSSLRNGEFAVRLGGDEIVILRDLSVKSQRRGQNTNVQKENRVNEDRRRSNHPETLVTRVLESLERADNRFKLHVGSNKINPIISASIGHARSRKNDTLEALLARADSKMFKDKRNRPLAS